MTHLVDTSNPQRLSLSGLEESKPDFYDKVNDYRGRVIAWIEEPNACQTGRYILTTIFMVFLTVVTLGAALIVLELAKRKVRQQSPINTFSLPTSFGTVPEKTIFDMQAQLVYRKGCNAPLDLQELKKQGLLPKHTMSIGKATYYCSDLFDYHGHLMITAFIELEGKVYPRLFYHSNSQGTWRVMPYAKKMDGRVVWYGKGKTEADTQLPTSLICALNKQHRVLSSKVDLSFLVETADYSGIATQTNLPATFMNEIRIDLSLLDNESQYVPYEHPGTQTKPKEIIDPKSLTMPGDKSKWPNFKRKFEFKHTLPQYGEVKVCIFPSQDESLVYMFYEASDNRAFLANIENVKDAEINKFGVRARSQYMRGMDAPLIEYPNKIHSPPNDKAVPYLCSGTYQSNWNFVRELPIMSLYYTEQGKTLPPAV